MERNALRGTDLNLLVLLDALLETGSVTRAAAQCGVTQSTMSHALSRLRERFDDPLLVRTAKGMDPTPRALALRGPLRQLLEQTSQLWAEPRRFAPLESRDTFVIAATDYAELVLLPSLMALLAVEAPGVSVRIVPFPADVEAALESGACDLVIGVFPDLAPRMFQQKLFDEDFVCVVRRGHPKVKRKLTLKTFLSLGHIVTAPRGGTGSATDSALARKRLTRRVVLTTPHFLLVPWMVSRTDHVATLARRVASAMVQVLPLEVLENPVTLRPFTMTQVWAQARHQDSAHVWFRARLADVARSV